MAYTQYPNTTFVIDMTAELKWGRVFSELVTKTLDRYIWEWKRILIFVSSIAYASGRICNDCGEIPKCKQCDVSIQYHATTTWELYGLCPICKHQYNADPICETCNGHDIIMYGVGAQQVSDMIQAKRWVTPMILGGKFTSSLSKIKKLQSELNASQVILSTSVTIDSSPWLEVDAVVMLDADRWLFSPDYQAWWKSFLMMYQLVRQYESVPVLIQSFKPEHLSIVLACNQNIQKMKFLESQRREQFKYPPYAQMCVLHYKNEIEYRTVSTTTKLYQELEYLKQSYEYENLEIRATPPSIFKKFGKYRYTIVMKWQWLRAFMDIAYSKLKMRSRGFKVDWEPQALV